jgi:deazaflavin-dependent oxidoreductase (nitroreductase family)
VSFDTPNGTRGGRQPRANLFYRSFQRWMVNRVRRKQVKMRGGDLLVLTTIGRKTGEERANPVAWFPDEGDSRLIVASAAGATNNPAWYYNIAAHPDRIFIELAGTKQAVTAEQLEGEARDRAWKQITAAGPGFRKYETKTDRELPVIRLTPIPG